MKTSLRSFTGKTLSGMLAVLLLVTVFITGTPVYSQVNFTQTLTADFNKGVLNGVVVGSDNVYLQNAATDAGSWLTTTVLPQILTGHKAVSWIDKYAYIVGGYNDVSYSSAVYLAPINAGGVGTWTAQTSLPVALRDAAVVVGNNTIYVLGGRDGSQVYNTIYYASINTNGTLGAWQTSAVSLPVALWGHTACYLNGYLYVAGGTSSLTETTALSNVYYTRVDVNNTLSSFSTGTSLPQQRNRHAMVTYNSKLYVLGGYNNSGTRSNTVYIATPGLNGSTGAWSTGTALPVSISNHAAVATNGLITVMAGETGTGLTNAVYFANADAGALSWVTSPNTMYDITKDGAAFGGNGQVVYTGGTNLSGTPIYNSRYAPLTLTANYVNHGVFISYPFFQLGAERLINSISFTKTAVAPSSLEVSYRTALSNGQWSDWTALTATSPVVINLTREYLQYKVVFTSTGPGNSTLHDMTLTTPGTQLNGNLNAIPTFTKALSPYWATSDISFTAGTHTFEAGATVLFLPETGMTVSQANIICNGTAVDSVKFLYYTSETGLWDGIYFDPNSDNGVSSQFNYTVIANAGYGSNNANLYCNQTNEPLLTRCNIRNADGNGLRLISSNINVNNSIIRGNSEDGAALDNANPTFVNCSISYNGAAGIYHSSNTSEPTFSGSTIDHNLYALHYPSPNYTFLQPNGSPTLTANTYNGIVIDGGTVTGSSKTWTSITYDYFLLGTVYIYQYGSFVRLTIEPGNTIRSVAGAQIQVGGGGSYGGELYALGAADSLITFTSFTGVPGGWGGIYFTNESDNWGGHSQMDYCIVEHGSDYNIFASNTIQPDFLNNSQLRNALNDGARFANATSSVSNTQFLNNGRYPIYMMDPEANPTLTSNTFTGNTINMIALNGGHYYFDRTIVHYGIPYHVLNDILIGKYASHNRMTINPGVIMAFAPGKKLQIGTASYGGELYAIGTSVSPIIIRAYTNAAGGWEGIYFHTNSDEWGSTSVMEYCTVRHGNAYNIYLESTTQPSLTNCTIRNSASHGLVVYQSNPPVHNCSFISNAGYPIKYEDWSCNLHLQGNTYTTNGLNYIALSGGDYSQNRTLYNDGIPYHVLGDIRIILYASYSRITFTPGITLAFNPGLKLQVGLPSYGGSLWAVGKADSVITFKPYNDAVGGWQGIYFHDGNDNWGGTSPMTYCIIEKGSSYNILCEYSTQPTLTNCTIRNSGGHGLVETESNPSIQNCLFQNNNGYPLKYNDWICNSYIKGNTYTGNLNQFIAHPGGDITSNRTLYNDGIPYHITGNIRVYVYASHNRLTIRPGNTLAFDSATGIQLGVSASYGGDLWAEGKADSIITFKPISNTAGDWNGLHFTDWNDNWGGTSLLKYCVIEKANGYNIRADLSGQPLIENCRITGSTADGIKVTGNSSLVIRNTTITGNTTNGILFEGSSTATIGNAPTYTCSIYNNGGYEINNTSTGTINARYNYLGSTDSTMIMLQHVYDRFDDPTRGIVYISPFAHLPALTSATTVMSGYVKYANSGANPMKNAAMTIKDFSGATVASASTNTSGVYAFGAFPSGNYQLSITPSNAWAGVNSTDALLIMQHFAQVIPLNGINLAAADVNNSHSVNGTDALFVMKRYSAMISSFPSGDYLHHTENISLAGNVLTHNLQMLCFGDVNASYSPAKKSSGSVGLVYEGSVAMTPFTEFSLPVRIKSAMEVGAISLGFYYPEQYLEVTGAELVNGVADFSWSAADGLFRMGWCNLTPLTIADDGVVVVLKMKSKDLSGMPAGILLELYEECEFADGSAMVNNGTILSVPALESTLTGLEPAGETASLSVYPNPANVITTVGFTLRMESRVTISLMDQVGRSISVLTDESYNAGKHSIDLDVNQFSAGLYVLKAEIVHDGKTVTETRKLVVTR